MSQEDENNRAEVQIFLSSATSPRGHAICEFFKFTDTLSSRDQSSQMSLKVHLTAHLLSPSRDLDLHDNAARIRRDWNASRLRTSDFRRKTRRVERTRSLIRAYRAISNRVSRPTSTRSMKRLHASPRLIDELSQSSLTARRLREIRRRPRASARFRGGISSTTGADAGSSG